MDDDLLESDTKDISEQPKQNIIKLLLGTLTLALTISVFVIFYVLGLNEAPADFPVNGDLIIREGATVNEISKQLFDEGYIKSPFYMYLVLNTSFSNKYVQAGSHRFITPLRANEIARAITSGTHNTPPNKITLPEGFRVDDILNYLPEKYADTDISDIKKYEGYLFPDTYFIAEDTSFDEIISLLNDTFIEKTTALQSEIENSGFTLEEVIILASIIEREANDEESMRMVAGVLMNRLEIGMALQVDAGFEYLLRKTSSELTEEDLAIDSPYNTYINKGLPPAPIANPGLLAINAVLNPLKNGHLYYLTGNDGKFYYAETFEEHKQNKFTYLR